MKKKYLLFFLSLIIISNNVKAQEVYKDVTNDIEIRYKWYKETIEGKGEYYPLIQIKEGDKYDKNNVKYVDTTILNEKFCSYPEEYYRIDRRKFKSYIKIHDAQYVVIENIEPGTVVKIHYKNCDLDYRIISQENNKLVLDLKMERLCDQLLFFIDTNNKYKISLYRDKELEQLIISKEIEKDKTSVPNYKWNIEPDAYHVTDLTELPYIETSLTKLKEERIICGCSEKYVYKYNVKREYYDDNYHKYIEGYIKDENDYRYYYKGEPIVINNTIEIIKEKIKEVPKLEYIYLEKEPNPNSQKEECPKEIETKIETKIIEKEVTKIPKKIYIIIIMLSLGISTFFIKEIIKKCR